MRPHGQQPTRLLCPQNSLCKSTGVGCHFLLQNTRLAFLKMKPLPPAADSGSCSASMQIVSKKQRRLSQSSSVTPSLALCGPLFIIHWLELSISVQHWFAFSSLSFVILSIPKDFFFNAVKYLFARVHLKDTLLVRFLLSECCATKDSKVSVAYQKHFFFFIGLWGSRGSSALLYWRGSGLLHISLIILGPAATRDHSPHDKGHQAKLQEHI